VATPETRPSQEPAAETEAPADETPVLDPGTPDDATTPAATPEPVGTAEPVATAEPVEPVAPIETPEAGAELPAATPAASATPELEAALAAPVTVESISPNDQMLPGQIREYHFRVVNSGDAAATVRFAVENVLPGWTGRVVHVDGTVPDGSVEIAPGQNIRVVVEVGAPLDSRSGDRNTTALVVEPLQQA
jgi:hypothetical protein